MEPSGVTVTDVARRAGVSQATVSAALHGRGRVGEERRRQIIEIANELGYQPRVAAQLLRARKTRQLGVIVAATGGVQAFTQDLQRKSLGRFVQTCTESGLRYVIEFSHHEQENSGEFAPPSQVTAKLVDGTLLIGDVGDRLRQWLAEYNGCHWVSIEEPAPLCVLSAADRGVQAVIRRFVELGHRKIGYIGGPERYAMHRLAVQGYRQVCREHGLPQLVQAFPGQLDATEAEAMVMWARQLLCSADRPTAIFCHGETVARAVVYAAVETGLKIPQDLSLVSYGSSEEACRRYPFLTTLENDYEAVTTDALAMLMQRINGQAVEDGQRFIVPRMVDGRTLGPVPAQVIAGKLRL